MIEIIIVIAIMAILIAALGPVYSRYLDKAKKTNDSDLAGKLKTAVETTMIDPDYTAPADGTYTLPTASFTTTDFWDGVAEILKYDDGTDMFAATGLKAKLKEKSATGFTIEISGNKVIVKVTGTSIVID